MKSFAYVLAGLPALALAADITVQVGPTSTLAFVPPTVTAATGDVVHFIFNPKNHSVTQSTFNAPCAAMAGGQASGFQPYNDTTQPQPTFNFTVTDATKPVWFYCGQTNPIVHCAQGMVFAINPPATGNTFDAFQAAAKGGAAAASGSGTASGGAAATGSGTASGDAAATGSGSGTATGGAAGSTSTTPGTGSGTATTGSPSTTGTSAAIAVAAPVGMAAVVAGFAALFI